MLCPNRNYKQKLSLNIHRLKHCAFFFYMTNKVIWNRHCDWHWMTWQQLGDQTSCLFDLRSRIRCAVAKHEIKKNNGAFKKLWQKSIDITLWILWVERWQICLWAGVRVNVQTLSWSGQCVCVSHLELDQRWSRSVEDVGSGVTVRRRRLAQFVQSVNRIKKNILKYNFIYILHICNIFGKTNIYSTIYVKIYMVSNIFNDFF